MSCEDTKTRIHSLESSLNCIHSPQNYSLEKMKPAERSGTVAVLVTNETLPEEGLRLDPEPDGYILGTGNGNIWSMLSLFGQDQVPKGVISLDHDLGVVLSGKLLVQFAKNGCSAGETLKKLFYVNEAVACAKEIALSESDPVFCKALLDLINSGLFAEDMALLSTLEQENRPPDIRRRSTVTHAICENWSIISQLANEGNIVFAHADLVDDHVLELIERQVPDICRSTNILYTSNVVDRRYRNEVNALERFNPDGKSWYVYTSQDYDDYVLRANHFPPVYPR